MMRAWRRSWLLAVLAAVLVSTASGCPRTAPRTSGSGRARAGGDTSGPVEDTLATVRQSLASAPDPATCLTALQQLNGYLGRHPEHRWAALTPEQKAVLAKFTADAGELQEIDSSSFTLLDAHHLEFSLLLRDAVRSLEVGKLPPAEQAAAGFAWVMRQVRLVAGAGPAVPPEYVLRRGWGSGLERALVVLAVWRQMGLPGVLVAAPGREEPWACGAVVPVAGLAGGRKQVVLFDPRLGLPVPGDKGPAAGELARAFQRGLPVAGPENGREDGREDGREAATLAAVRVRPELVAALGGTGGQPAYDVSAEQVQGATVRLAEPVSALAPRQRVLEKEFLGEAVPVRLGVDPRALVKEVAGAAGVEGGEEGVKSWPGAAGIVRSFLPDKEGGIDTRRRAEQYQLSLLPLNLLPPALQQLEGEPRVALWSRFLEPFASFLTAPGQPRDLLLRGRTKELSEVLSPAIDQIRLLKGKIEQAPELAEQFGAWRQDIYQAYGDLARAQQAAARGGDRGAVEAARGQIEKVMKAYQPTLVAVVEGAASEPRLIQAMGTQAQGMQEQAVRMQVRAETLARAGAAAEDVASARGQASAAWQEAAAWWESLLQEFPATPFAGTARLGLAQAADHLGQRERARGLLLEGLAGLRPEEQQARQYLAGRLGP